MNACHSLGLLCKTTLFTKFLTPGLTHKSCNMQHDWLDWLISTNHRTDYVIRKLIRDKKKVKKLANKTYTVLTDLHISGCPEYDFVISRKYLPLLGSVQNKHFMAIITRKLTKRIL